MGPSPRESATAGIFTPPRSGHELTRSQIAARVSHTFYRDRFIRSGGKVALAG